MPTYHVTALDHQGQLLITHDHDSRRPLRCVEIRPPWQAGTIAVTGPCGCVLAIIAIPHNHPSQQPAAINVQLEHTTQ